MDQDWFGRLHETWKEAEHRLSKCWWTFLLLLLALLPGDLLWHRMLGTINEFLDSKKGNMVEFAQMVFSKLPTNPVSISISIAILTTVFIFGHSYWDTRKRSGTLSPIRHPISNSVKIHDRKSLSSSPFGLSEQLQLSNEDGLCAMVSRDSGVSLIGTVIGLQMTFTNNLLPHKHLENCRVLVMDGQSLDAKTGIFRPSYKFSPCLIMNAAIPSGRTTDKSWLVMTSRNLGMEIRQL